MHVFKRKEMDKQELRKKWIDTLRSDKYEQGRTSLRSLDNKYCCLGVLCDIIDNTKWNRLRSWMFPGDLVGYQYITDRDMNSSSLPKEYVDLIGLNDPLGCKKEPLQNGSLAQLNDLGKTFQQIADALETGVYWAEN